MEQSSRPPVRSVRRPLLRSVVELEAHVLIATSRTSGRTSPPNTGIPMFVIRMCIKPSVLCATTTSLALYPPAENLSTTSLNFSQWKLVSMSALQLVSFSWVPLVCSLPPRPERIEFLMRMVVSKKDFL
jgi:hypothetical protein